MEYTLITGASGGIGEALAIKLAKKKHNLILVARNAEKLSKLSKHLQETYGVQATYIAADLTKQDAPFQIFQETQKQNWEVDMLVNNAGIGSGGEFAVLNLQSELDLIQLNNASLVDKKTFPGIRKQKPDRRTVDYLIAECDDRPIYGQFLSEKIRFDLANLYDGNDNNGSHSVDQPAARTLAAAEAQASAGEPDEV
ncbi:SDR family oxidoreductase [Dyadobacter sp. CY347]|uniref:SDR family NAD(P)-dependent oxidoreductase n=1 Tax=Dyadobacter sp. CY347 TaxID=2909336 RepID=UPI001F1FA448|nr:SDR family NAD(P)-dependent oxidoreductase [Dyadobacter sp. CY347]MCF2487712.1 SDR family NAD(P)-dependent oxidoreductase [Dyadobacter sp. CY347]